MGAKVEMLNSGKVRILVDGLEESVRNDGAILPSLESAVDLHVVLSEFLAKHIPEPETPDPTMEMLVYDETRRVGG